MSTARKFAGYLVWGVGIGIGFSIVAPNVPPFSSRWDAALVVVCIITFAGDHLSGWRSRKVECPHCGKMLRCRAHTSDQ